MKTLSQIRPSNLFKPSFNDRDTIDFRRAAVGFEIYDSCANGDVISNDHVELAFKEVKSWPEMLLRRHVHDCITAQLEKMFNSLKSFNYNDKTGVNPTLPKDQQMLDEDVILKEHLMKTVGYTLTVNKSSIYNGGNGLFINLKKGTMLPPGSVVALIPGLVYLTEYTCKNNFELMRSLMPDPNFNLFVRSDKNLIDSREANHVTIPRNPYAYGHMANHPEKGGKSNLLSIAYDYQQDIFGMDCFPQELRQYIPNSYAFPPTLMGLGTNDRSAFMHTMVYITTRTIGGEDTEVKIDKNSYSYNETFDSEISRHELKINYRLDPGMKNDHPEWYSHIPEEDDVSIIV